MGQEGFSQDVVAALPPPLAAARSSRSSRSTTTPVPAHARRIPLLPRHLRTGDARRRGDADRCSAAPCCSATTTCGSRGSRPTADSALYRNAIGDELVYVQRGRRSLESCSARSTVGPGDYVVIPAVDDPPVAWSAMRARSSALVLEPSRPRAPSRASTCTRSRPVPRGLRRTASATSAARRRPARRRDGPKTCRCSCATAPACRAHVHATIPSTSSAGTAACTRGRLSIHDFEPIVGALHQPPPVHQTFEGPGFVVCSFVPRLFDFHPDAVKVPYHHANVDSDEVLFYSAGDFMSRAGSRHRRRFDLVPPGRASCTVRSPAASSERSTRRAPRSWR